MSNVDGIPIILMTQLMLNDGFTQCLHCVSVVHLVYTHNGIQHHQITWAVAQYKLDVKPGVIFLHRKNMKLMKDNLCGLGCP